MVSTAGLPPKRGQPAPRTRGAGHPAAQPPRTIPPLLSVFAEQMAQAGQGNPPREWRRSGAAPVGASGGRGRDKTAQTAAGESWPFGLHVKGDITAGGWGSQRISASSTGAARSRNAMISPVARRGNGSAWAASAEQSTVPRPGSGEEGGQLVKVRTGARVQDHHIVQKA